MEVRIRLKRFGAKKQAKHRIVVISREKARDSRSIEELGAYDPGKKVLSLNLERTDYWLGEGAQPSDTVKQLIKKYRKDGCLIPKPKKPKKKAPKPEASEAAPEAEATEAPAEAASEEATAEAPEAEATEATEESSDKDA